MNPIKKTHAQLHVTSRLCVSSPEHRTETEGLAEVPDIDARRGVEGDPGSDYTCLLIREDKEGQIRAGIVNCGELHG